MFLFVLSTVLSGRLRERYRKQESRRKTNPWQGVRASGLLRLRDRFPRRETRRKNPLDLKNSDVLCAAVHSLSHGSDRESQTLGNFGNSENTRKGKKVIFIDSKVYQENRKCYFRYSLYLTAVWQTFILYADWQVIDAKKTVEQFQNVY